MGVQVLLKGFCNDKRYVVAKTRVLKGSDDIRLREPFSILKTINALREEIPSNKNNCVKNINAIYLSANFIYYDTIESGNFKGQLQLRFPVR